ncbi:phage holin family protein [Paraburkholderia sp. Tr-20389]|uniref:phage holin family protein n=1 Tax=Paraburkholderia sp. Tr-20389 TaxID=2703903 RepID=UPI0019812A86|nr:phage holin family protein [Paraburkholderia sp. Tr-20389]MBN3757669.1 phage holin family protein [Paraburkholderia sp. Tr-20389]
MSIHLRATCWRNVGRFYASRIADYSELFSIELEQARTRLVREVIALIVLAVAALFSLSFLSVAVIATALGTPYFVYVAWGVAGVWVVLCVASYAVVRTQRPARSFDGLREELRNDLETAREALR